MVDIAAVMEALENRMRPYLDGFGHARRAALHRRTVCAQHLLLACCVMAAVRCSPKQSQAQPAWRMLPTLDHRVFGCSGSPASRAFADSAAVERYLDSLFEKNASPHCTELRAWFHASLRASGFDWQQEALVLMRDWYGTGMANAHLDVTLDSAATLHAAIVWQLPPPPHTPDTKTFSAAFAARKASVRQVSLTGRNTVAVVFPL
jgi:hypothetical protein